jgi:hypothetical protein
LDWGLIYACSEMRETTRHLPFLPCFFRIQDYFRNMTDHEDQLLRALVELETAVARMPSANPKPDLKPLFSWIDALAARLPADAPRDLRHYLQRKSYQKARLFLQEDAGAAAASGGAV